MNAEGFQVCELLKVRQRRSCMPLFMYTIEYNEVARFSVEEGGVGYIKGSGIFAWDENG